VTDLLIELKTVGTEDLTILATPVSQRLVVATGKIEVER
jgi:hypothetical protein